MIHSGVREQLPLLMVDGGCSTAVERSHPLLDGALLPPSHPTHCRIFHCSAQLTTLVLTSDGFGVCQHLLVLMLAPAVVERSYTPLLVPHLVPPGAQLIYPTAVPQP